MNCAGELKHLNVTTIVELKVALVIGCLAVWESVAVVVAVAKTANLIMEVGFLVEVLLLDHPTTIPLD